MPSPRPPDRPARPGRIRQGDRDKAYRPLPIAARRAAFERAMSAYARGDFFAAHEDLEPAWMGTDDLAERALHQGLIKLAAAYVHAVRRNPLGVAKNLAGARRHLSRAGSAGAAWGVDVASLLADIDARLASDDLASDDLASDDLASDRLPSRGAAPTGPTPAALAATPPRIRRIATT